MAVDYTRIFDPAEPRLGARTGAHEDVGDRGAPLGYVFSEAIVLAVNVALAAGRPLLVRGPSGIGKSSLARSVSAHLGWSYFEAVVTSRTEARDFLWRTDDLKRLRDAQIGAAVQDQEAYTTPGVLFWAFDPQFAADMLRRTGRGALVPPDYREDAAGTVVLIDEIDKADPDVPNSLLEPLGMLSFDVEDLGLRVGARRPPFLMLTTNEERDLPQAFLRRCVELEIGPPDAERLVTIARSHFPDQDEAFFRAIAELMEDHAREAGRPASVAEYLDTIRACLRLGVGPDDDAFRLISEATLWKRGRLGAAR